MNKRDLIRAISREMNQPVSQEKIAMVLDAAVDVIKRTLADGESVKWSGFGSLAVKEVPSKKIFSPVLKEYIISKSTRRIVFVEPGKRK